MLSKLKCFFFSVLCLSLDFSLSSAITQENIVQKNENDYVKTATELLKQQKYSEAAKIYRTLLAGNPNHLEYLVELGVLEVRLGDKKKAIELYNRALKIDPRNQQVEVALAFAYLFDGDLQKSDALFRQVVEQSPGNAEALAGIGNIYILQGKFSDAEIFLQKALKSSPNAITARIYLGNLRLRQHRYTEAKIIFEGLNSEDPNNPDVHEALYEINQLEIALLEPLLKKNKETTVIIENAPKPTTPLANNESEAVKKASQLVKEKQYQKALEIDPTNAAALAYYADQNLKQKKYREAFAIYSKLLTIDSMNADYREGFTNSLELPMVERAKKLQEIKDDAGASALYEYLIAHSPEKIEFYLGLGRTYINRNRQNDAIDLYRQGLNIKPDDVDLLRALGFIYLYKALDDRSAGALEWQTNFPFVRLKKQKNLATSKCFFEAVLKKNPTDADAIAGMGRIALIKGFPEEAENLYLEALYREPKNTTALSYLAALQSQQKKYTSGDATYRQLIALDPKDSDARNNYKEFLDIKQPYIDLTGVYEEENEKEFLTATTRDWVARLKNYGAAVTLVQPLRDQLKMVANFESDRIVLRNLISQLEIYSVSIQQPKLGFIWNTTPYLSISGGITLASFLQYHRSTFFTKKGCYYLPYFNIYYNKNHHTCSLETIGDAPIVARNFETNQSTLVARQLVNGFYEYDFGQRRSAGALATYASYYNRIKNNQYQFGSAWLQWTPSCYWENISLRYQFNYGRFNDLTIDYYTYRPQTTHWLKLNLTKNWCSDQVATEAGLQRAWQRSFEQGQIIVIVPVPSYHWVNRTIDSAYARIKVLINDCLNATVLGTYSRDNFDYTTASISANVHIRF